MTRWRHVVTAFGSIALACGAMVWATAPSYAQQGPTEEDLLSALKPHTPRSGIDPLPGSVEEQRFIDRIRTDRTRQQALNRPTLSDNRPTLSDIIVEKPKIDLDIPFAYNSAEILSTSKSSLMALGRALADPSLRGNVFLIAGHTDGVGSEEYNQVLSERRADAVKRFLTDNFGIPKEDLVSVGYGKTRLKNAGNPLSSENRRIEIVNLGGGCRRGPSSAPFC